MKPAAPPREAPAVERAVPPLGAVNRQRLVQYFFFGVFLLLIHQVVRMLAPFLVAILGSAVLAITLFPLHARIAARLGAFPPSLAAGASTSLIVLVAVLPVLVFGWIFIKESSRVTPAAKAFVERARDLREREAWIPVPEPLRRPWERAESALEVLHVDLKDILLKNLDEMSTAATQMAGRLVRNTVYVAFNLVVLVFTLFFFLRDGPYILRRLTELVPMAADHKAVIVARIQETLFGVLRGVLILSMLQGALAGLGFWAFGVPFAVLLGVLSVFLAPIPFIGTAGVWIPVSACLALSGQVEKAVYVAAWSAAVVSTVDNLLRPYLVGAHTRIPVLLLFFGFLGGLRVYGFVGLLLGPLIIALTLAFIKIYRQEYGALLGEGVGTGSRNCAPRGS